MWRPVVFSSQLFLYGFLPAFLACYYIAPARWRNHVALAASMLFYAWGAPRFLVLLVSLAVADLWFSRVLHRISEAHERRRKLVLALAVSLNLAALVYFKYSSFFVVELNQLLKWCGLRSVRWAQVGLPIGISFITFEEISYLTDVYRRKAEPARNFATYLLFLLLFPHSIAGPIFRWNYMRDQLTARTHTITKFTEGLLRFCAGLAKKVLLANRFAAVADAVYAMPLDALPVGHAWLGMIAYALQLYFDFSGYSDMAIGLGKMIGFAFQENFDRPYQATTITDFWRRWHISLSTWMRDYLYVSLGGNRGSQTRTAINIFVVFLLSGFWHGANWTFMAWGAYHGLLVINDRLWWNRVAARLPRIANIALTSFMVAIGFVLFRSSSIHHALGYLHRQFSFGQIDQIVAASGGWGPLLPHRTILVLLLGAALAVGLDQPLRSASRSWWQRSDVWSLLRVSIGYGFALACLVGCMMSLANADFNPFIYFRF